jgi:hypothetical protein
VYSSLFNSQDAGELSFVGSELVLEDLANNWGWIMAGGVLNVIDGSHLLAYSVLGTVLSEILFVRCLCCSKSIKPLWHGEKGNKTQSFLLGLSQLSIAYVVNTFPLDSMLCITNSLLMPCTVRRSVFSTRIYQAEILSLLLELRPPLVEPTFSLTLLLLNLLF